MGYVRKSLKKELTLFDVFTISTGAMFSSGFFLLPGLAAIQTGPSVVLAYLSASILILPAMFSIAELSTAMPKAGGTYYFLDRSMGPRVGTVGGLGIYWILILKTAFALIGIGAYTAIFFDLPIRMVAIALTVVFMLLNIVGAKETANLQRVFVIVLIGILSLFVIQGLHEVYVQEPDKVIDKQFTPLFTAGWEGFASTIGFVFVSYIGLTKVASVAEEVQRPERNLPLGMMLSLFVTTLFYVIGIFIIVAMMEPSVLHKTLTPVAATVNTFSEWIPTSISIFLIMVAAIAAFASTGNAGLLSASRYPLAMARDHVLPKKFLRLGRFHTPVFSIFLTSVIIILIILFVREETIAKLASAFQLFVFALINFAVIVMRESRITSYDPGFHSPFYPWMQIFGIVSFLGLIVMMGVMAVLFTITIVLIGLGWYGYYARGRILREGAIYHWFANLGTRRYEKLDIELRGILRDKGLRESDPFDEVLVHALVIDTDASITTFKKAIKAVATPLSKRLPISDKELVTGILQGTQIGATPVLKGVAIPHLHLSGVSHPEMAIIRSFRGIKFKFSDIHSQEHGKEMIIHAIIVLVSPEDDPKQHLRMLAHIAGRVDSPEFMHNWMAAPNDSALRETLLSEKNFFELHLQESVPSGVLVGKSLSEIHFPHGTLVVLIKRGEKTITPNGDTVLELQDKLTIIGDRYTTLRTIHQQYLGVE